MLSLLVVLLYLSVLATPLLLIACAKKKNESRASINPSESKPKSTSNKDRESAGSGKGSPKKKKDPDGLQYDSPVRTNRIALPEVFLLMQLPNEIILMILAFLPTVDRLRARVNRRLREIEAEGRFRGGQLVLAGSKFPWFGYEDDEWNVLMTMKRVDRSLNKTRNVILDGLEKLIVNTKMKSVLFSFEANRDDKFTNIIQQFKKTQLSVRFATKKLGAKFLTDANFNDWMKGSRFLLFNEAVGLSSKVLFDLFADMEERLCSLRSLQLEDVPNAVCVDLLDQLEVTHETTSWTRRLPPHGQEHTSYETEFFSNQTDVQVYRELGRARMRCGWEPYMKEHYVFIFGNNMKVTIPGHAFHGYPETASLAIERTNSDGTIPSRWRKFYKLRASIDEIERRVETEDGVLFSRVTVNQY